ncbi:hypothetical protein GQ600_3679 [Phytophthora cactorum]|nr:hypothetical protein GQ600_3679 [Phytophthora cactorum]
MPGSEVDSPLTRIERGFPHLVMCAVDPKCLHCGICEDCRTRARHLLTRIISRHSGRLEGQKYELRCRVCYFHARWSAAKRAIRIIPSA